MPSTYKTPGVYVEEISVFPPSVAPVETAIPAFIGYTEKIIDSKGEGLLNVPTKISSMVDYREKYGGEPPISISAINLNSTNTVTSVDMTDTNYLYDSLRLFFANGGGDCYIVTVGEYGDTIQNGAADGSTQGFLTGLEKLRKVDQPTLVLAPDAVIMTQSNLDTLYQAFLSHCNDLQDRFSVFDLKEKDPDDHEQAIDDFRSGIGVNYLSYGAAYTPWLKATLPRTVNFKDVRGNIMKSGVSATLLSLVDATSTEAQFTAERLDNLVQDCDLYKAQLAALIGSNSSLQEAYSALYTNYLNGTTGPSRKSRLQTLFELFLDTIFVFDTAVGASGFTDALSAYTAYPTLTSGKTYLADYTNTFLSPSFESTLEKIRDYIAEADTELTGFTPTTPTWVNTPFTTIFAAPAVAANVFTTGSTNTEKMANAEASVQTLWVEIRSAVEHIQETLDALFSQIEDAATLQIPTYKTIKDYIANELVTLPPSGAMVGIYARTDSNRGVWKAPANESVFSVSGVTEKIDDREQRDLNVDVVAGKSINVIRPFTGKGILVWGGRTLAGNDNEWRYISVRRFFIFAEESIKKATERFVFEPNDANTWVKVKAMIENFLTVQWRAGALAGAKPEHAFFVKVGLSETMTSLDILEGRMIVEIGMAVVRPAEFIILRFSHKMQES